MNLKLIYIAAILSLAAITSSPAAYRAPVWSTQGLAATPHPAATEAAGAILQAGGNAVDAALAAAFALAVVEPYHSGLGGGEFALACPAGSAQVFALDARECAPAKAKPDMYLNPVTGEPRGSKSWLGGLAVGIPGSVAGRIELHRRFGKLPLEKVVKPSIKLAQDGFPVDRYLVGKIKDKTDALAERPGCAQVFLVKGKPPERGSLLRQPALAATLKQIAEDQGRSFYCGKIAEQIVAACEKAGGILSLDDLANYKVLWREPVHFDYRGYDVYSMPPPSSGGVCLAEIFNILEGFPLSYLLSGSAETYHLLASAFDQAFADRAAWLGDPAFNPQPVGGLTSRAYAGEMRQRINRFYRVPVDSAGDPWAYDSEGNTSHISVIDAQGGMCAITTSVNSSFGSLVFVDESGFFLNNTMDDFSLKPSSPNRFDLVGGNVNQVEAGKRPLSSMSPTLVFKDSRPFMSLGSVGGPRIITSVAQILINMIDFGMDVQAAIDAPRIHTQWRPDKLYVEDEISPETLAELRRRGWNAVKDGHWSLSQAVVKDTSSASFYGAGDARGVGSAGPGE